jgi:phosphoribosylformylglycinamidine synthase
VAEGGLAGCLAEMAAAGGVGAQLDVAAEPAVLFGEAPGQVVLCVTEAELAGVEAAASAAGVPLRRLERAGGPTLRLGPIALEVSEVAGTWRRRLREAFATGAPSA